jgi:penicillin amidase
MRQAPVLWDEEDSLLTVFSMYIDLQSHDGKREHTLGVLKAHLPTDVYAFLNPKGSDWDATIDSNKFVPSPMPTAMPIEQLPNNPSQPSKPYMQQYLLQNTANDPEGDFMPGSNSWAVSGNLTSTGHAIIANDMHLGLRVPNTWYRASFEYPKDKTETLNSDTSFPKIVNPTIKITGATLPGMPNMVVGSNGAIAWGFTNSMGDFSDIVILKTNPDNTQYLTPKGYKNFSYHKQLIAVKGQKPEEITVMETVWGPVIGKNHEGALIAYRWVAHDTNAINLQGVHLEQAKTVNEAFTIANRAGIPSQNFLVADKWGDIGWTIMGPIPIKSEDVGEVPQSWATRKNAWLGYLPPTEYPRIINPKNDRLWTANSKVVGGEMLQKIGNGGYALGARAQQIKRRLFEKHHFDEKTLLAIGLDDEAIFLQRWQQFLLTKVPTAQSIENKPLFQQVKSLLQESKPLFASTDSVSYRIVRNFRLNTRDRVFAQFSQRFKGIDEQFNIRSLRHQTEVPLWQLVNKQPNNDNLLGKSSWQLLFTNALTDTLNDMTSQQSLADATWGQQNTATIKHPLSSALPFLTHWLDMPSTPLSGDSYMPKVQGKSFGASQRMIVSPGQEEFGIFHMPTSQASHPWSPYYGLGHRDWEQGIASAFLPGKTKYSLTLTSY